MATRVSWGGRAIDPRVGAIGALDAPIPLVDNPGDSHPYTFYGNNTMLKQDMINLTVPYLWIQGTRLQYGTKPHRGYVTYPHLTWQEKLFSEVTGNAPGFYLRVAEVTHVDFIDLPPILHGILQILQEDSPNKPELQRIKKKYVISFFQMMLAKDFDFAPSLFDQDRSLDLFLQ